MHVRVLTPVVHREPIDHRIRFLRRRGIVEIGERLAVDAGAKQRKVLSYGLHIQP